MKLYAPIKTDSVCFFDNERTKDQHNGVFKATLKDISVLMPDLYDVCKSVPDSGEFLFDVKTHMLMKGQYPCIPNWHCDFVPRENRELRYEKALSEITMYIWVSSSPETLFLQHDFDCGAMQSLKNHGDIYPLIKNEMCQKIEPFRWYGISQLTPHRGTEATEPCWRTFIRATRRDIADNIKERVTIRKHSQVYLDASNFTW